MVGSPRNGRRRNVVFALLPIIVLVAYLLWPLSSRRWDVADVDEESLRAKNDYLAAQRTVRGGPRVILIVADDLALTDISRYGAGVSPNAVHTPEIDSIGEDGATFTQAGTTATICAPSRAALLTGRYQQRFGFELQPHDRYARNRLEYLGFRYAIDTGHMRPVAPAPIPTPEAIRAQGLPASEITLAELLQARGYRTAAFGKWHLGYDRRFSPLERGFEEHYGFYEAFSLYAPLDAEGIVNTRIDDFSDRHMWSKGRTGAAAIVHNDRVVEEDDYLTFRFAELASDYIRSNAEEPFFLYLPFSAPHTPLQAPTEYHDRFLEIDDPIKRTYAAMIAALDDAVGSVLDAVDDAGIADETIVIFTSDNGGTSYLGVTDNAPLAGGKFTPFQGGVAVPLMMRYPARIPAGAVYSEPVSLLDVFATVDAATRRPERTIEDAEGGTDEQAVGGRLALDGVDLVPFVLGERDGAPHEALFWRSGYNKAARSGDWKLIVTEDGSPAIEEGEVRRELYNLARDPTERINVAAHHPDVVDELLARMAEWEAGLAEPLWPPVMHFRLDVWGRRLWFAI
jgi:arylsulfatase A-like enzyme